MVEIRFDFFFFPSRASMCDVMRIMPLSRLLLGQNQTFEMIFIKKKK